MTPEQTRFLELLSDSRHLAPEILTAVRKLAAEGLEPWQYENLVAALLDAPEKDDQESFIGGVIRG